MKKSTRPSHQSSLVHTAGISNPSWQCLPLTQTQAHSPAQNKLLGAPTRQRALRPTCLLFPSEWKLSHRKEGKKTRAGHFLSVSHSTPNNANFQKLILRQGRQSHFTDEETEAQEQRNNPKVHQEDTGKINHGTSTKMEYSVAMRKMRLIQIPVGEVSPRYIVSVTYYSNQAAKQILQNSVAKNHYKFS